MKLNKILRSLLISTALVLTPLNAQTIGNLTDGNGTQLNSTAIIDGLTGYYNGGAAAANQLKDKAAINFTDNDAIVLQWLEKGNGVSQIHKDIAEQILQNFENSPNMKALDTNNAIFQNLTPNSVQRAAALGHQRLAQMLATVLILNNTINGQLANNTKNLYRLPALGGLNAHSTVEQILALYPKAVAAPVQLPAHYIEVTTDKIVQDIAELAPTLKWYGAILYTAIEDAVTKSGLTKETADAVNALLRDIQLRINP